MSEPPDPETRILAERAGLGMALRDHPDDVAAAARAAAAALAGLKGPTDPAAEPWPPMRMGPPA